MNKSLENFKKYLPLLQQFVKRDFKTKYRRSVLGILWSVLNPLGMMLVMTVVFSHLFRAGIENFPVYLMCGQLVFNFYNEASNSAMNSIIWNGALIKKVYIPKYLLPMSSVCTSLCEPLNIVYCVNYCYCDNKISGFMDIFTGNSSGYLHMDVCIWNGNDFMCFSDGF